MSDLLQTGDTLATPPVATPAAATPASAPPQATPVAPPASATPSVPEGYVPSWRLRETREAASREAEARFAQREAEIRREADQYRQQLHALVGAQPPPNPENTAVKAQFATLYPGLSKIEERAADIERILERSGDLEAQNEHYWQEYGRRSMTTLYTKAETSLGAPLTEEGKRQLHASFTGFVSSSPELTLRYANDPTIVDDFWKQFTSSFIDPVRRVASATMIGRVPGNLPQDTPSGALRPSPGVTPQNLDERAALAWTQYSQNKT